MVEMDNSKSEDIEQGGKVTAAADGNAAMDVDITDVEKKAPHGQEDELPDDSDKPEVDDETPPTCEVDSEANVAKVEDMVERTGEDKNSIEIETGNGGDPDANSGAGSVVGGAEDDHSVREGLEQETPFTNENKGGEKVPGENQMDDSVVAEGKFKEPEESVNGGTQIEACVQNGTEKDEKPKELNNGVKGMDMCLQDGGKKEEGNNELIPKHSFTQNGPKKEDLKNEVKSVNVEEPKRGVTAVQPAVHNETRREPIIHAKEKLLKPEPDRVCESDVRTPARSFLGDPDVDGYESGTDEEQRAFIHELEVFHRERGLDFKAPKFYQEQLNLLKLWRWVIKLGGYEQVTSCKLWRQVGESFKPPKTCTTVSWTFRGFYEKTLLEYEKHKILSGELPEIDASFPDSMSPGTQGGLSQASGSGRARRDAAARAMQGWHSLRVSSNGEVGDPIIKDKNSMSLGKREKQLKNIGLLKRQKQSPVEQAAKGGHVKSPKPHDASTVEPLMDTSSSSRAYIPESMVVDIGPPADWVKINVQRTKDCFEVYALVPGLLREEVRVQSDPAGRLVISGQPEHLDNPWGVTPFKKVVSLPSRIDPHQTSAVVTLHGQLFVRVPFEQSDT